MSFIVIQVVDLDNYYVQRYIADGYDGQGFLQVTPDIERAKRYPDVRAVLEEWKRVSKTHPVRRDGKPNRPLSGHTISTVTVE